MFLRPHSRNKDGKDHTYWSLVETVRTPDGPRQKTLCYLGELNSSAQARWLKTVEVFNEAGRSAATETVPLACGAAAGRSAGSAGAAEQGTSGKNAAVRRVLSRTGTVEASANWIVSSSRPSMARPPMCRGRAWRRCWRSIVCARRAANWPSSSAGIRPRRWTICWRSKKARSTTRACTAVWTAFCRTRRSWSGI